MVSGRMVNGSGQMEPDGNGRVMKFGKVDSHKMMLIIFILE